MRSRLSYIFGETFASFRRNPTLTVAAIITSAVALLIFGLTLFIQRGFDNLLVQWEEGVEVIVWTDPGVTEDQKSEIEATFNGQNEFIDEFRFCDLECVQEIADRVISDPITRETLTDDLIPRQYFLVPTDATDVDQLQTLAESWATLPGVTNVVFAEEELDVISKLKGFVSLYTVILSMVLLIAAVLLIWNTIRTAMYARRREIEVMKLVGATDWFIRIPFMLEGLIQGLLGSLVACFGLGIINNRWTAGLQDFPPNSGFQAMYVPTEFAVERYVWLVVIGMAVGAIGAGVAASKFLDV